MKRVNIALESQGFVTYQQSIVQLSKSDVASPHGVELLNRPILGDEFTSTEEFYSFSASHGRSSDLDTYTIRLGLQRFHDNCSRSSKTSGASSIFVNVHLSTLFSAEWDLLASNLPIESGAVVLELSEREGLNTYSEKDVGVKIDSLQRMGMKIAVDDVGMGYSGLHTLAMVHPDYVKIDRQLVSHIEEDAYRQHMMSSLIQYWKREGVSVIAEGLERPEEVAFFTEVGATFGQGYWFHKPESIMPELVETT